MLMNLLRKTIHGPSQLHLMGARFFFSPKQKVFASLRAEWISMLIFSTVNHLSSQMCGFEPSSWHMWDKPGSAKGWSGGVSQWSPVFDPALRLTRLKMSEIILTGHKTQIKKIYKNCQSVLSNVTILFLSFRTDRSGPSVQTKTWLQSDQGLHC